VSGWALAWPPGIDIAAVIVGGLTLTMGLGLFILLGIWLVQAVWIIPMVVSFRKSGQRETMKALLSRQRSHFCSTQVVGDW
jgi:hypothetical protein